ncbi:MAG: DegT/DnrJ/EryC1/StrS family aminotransferase [Lachnospiraceae bacterium]|nr:DegT/DnrJ/EryC1/StrS family aminotransferase [Lachnospiraceae bacterium]
MEFINLKRQYERLKTQIDKNIREVITQSAFIGGRFINELEEKLAAYVGRKHCISCDNGTTALQLAYMAYGLGERDVVFCPDMTFIASAEPAYMLGIQVVFCDIKPDTYNLDPGHLEKQILRVLSEGKYVPKAVVAVDFLGNPADMEQIADICKKYNMILIEDAAQSMSAEYKGKKCGSFGEISCTSFFPSKPLGGYGDGGACFTDDDEVAEVIRSMKVHGKGKDKYDNVRVGLNARLDHIQAAVLLPKLSVLEEELELRQAVAKRYDEAFRGKLQIPYIEACGKSSYAQYCVLTKSEEQRSRLIQGLKENDIPSLIYYPKCMHEQKVFRYMEAGGAYGGFPNAERYAVCNLGLPFSPYLTKEEQEKVIRTVLHIFS